MQPAAERASSVRYVIPPRAATAVEVEGTDAVFPVCRVFCVGRNYAEHAVEMGHDPTREPPFFFMKPPTAVVPTGSTLPFPSATEDLHHEIELVVALERGGRDIGADDALSRVFGYAVGLDMTRRDLQEQAKKARRPWDMAKGFDRSAPLSPHPSGIEHRGPCRGGDHPARQRSAATGGRSRPADLEGARDHRLPEHVGGAPAWRSDPDRDAQGRRSRRARRPSRDTSRALAI
jgi:hypothetical protein